MNGRPRLFLDYNAGAPLIAEARAALIDALDAANPSSVHDEGRRGRAIVEKARRSVADLVGAASTNVVFTSGASEAAALALQSCWSLDARDVRFSKLAVLETDHPALREGGSFDSANVRLLKVDRAGIVVLDELARWCDELPDDSYGLLAMTLANSETGVLQPLDKIRASIEGRPVLLVVDAVQVAGRQSLQLDETGADALILSGHKLGAVKGVGALILRNGAKRPLPLVRGGGQESGRRGGTEAVPAIASFGAAAEVARDALSLGARALHELRDYCEAQLRQAVPTAVVLGQEADRLPNTVAVAVKGLPAETAQIALDLEGIAVSAGSACSSGKVGPSHVVAAMEKAGAPVRAADGALRVSFGALTTRSDIDRFIAAYSSIAGRKPEVERAA